MSRRSAAVRRGLPPAAMGVSATSDRRFRRPDVRPTGPGSLRRLSGRVVVYGVLALAVVALLVYAGRAAMTSSLLRVRQISVNGTHRLRPEEVASLVDDLRQENILLVNLPRYQQRLRGSAWIQDVTLRRQLPSSVVIDVTERTPMVLARIGDRLFLVDRTGAIIDENGPQYRDLDMPVVDGLPPSGDAASGSLDQWHVALVERFLNALGSAPDLKSRIAHIDISDPHDLMVLLEGDSTFVRLGDEHFVERLRRYLTLKPALHARLSDLDYVDVRFDNLYVMPRGRVSVSVTSRPVRRP